jgi:hypothetical protein
MITKKLHIYAIFFVMEKRQHPGIHNPVISDI